MAGQPSIALILRVRRLGRLAPGRGGPASRQADQLPGPLLHDALNLAQLHARLLQLLPQRLDDRVALGEHRLHAAVDHVHVRRLGVAVLLQLLLPLRLRRHHAILHPLLRLQSLPPQLALPPPQQLALLLPLVLGGAERRLEQPHLLLGLLVFLPQRVQLILHVVPRVAQLVARLPPADLVLLQLRHALAVLLVLLQHAPLQLLPQRVQLFPPVRVALRCAPRVGLLRLPKEALELGALLVKLAAHRLHLAAVLLLLLLQPQRQLVRLGRQRGLLPLVLSPHFRRPLRHIAHLLLQPLYLELVLPVLCLRLVFELLLR
mmetsp:Transcript_14208/g.36815  ORF Transcript_14208/g.36815 Transcript_14208/m.36815 type:complete len:318 (-) Transcript_14208:389-1342(-)